MKTQVEKKLKNYSATQLVSKLEKGNMTDIEREVAIEILKKRGQDVSKWEITLEAQEPEVEKALVPVQEELKEEEQTPVSLPMEPTPAEQVLSELAREVDEFVDEIILQKRSGVYGEVMKALGGRPDSDLDEILEKATKEQLKDALSFRGLKKSEEPKKPQKAKVEKKESEDISTTDNDGIEVEFVTSSNSKKAPGQTLRGKVIKSFICPKVKKEFYRIKTKEGIFLKKASSCKKI